MTLDRRTALVLLGGAPALLGDEGLRFFTADEDALLDRVAEIILPADQHSPGAHEAKVSRYLDLLVSRSSGAVQAQWRARLQAFDRLGGKPFLQLTPSEQATWLQRAAAGEGSPASDAERFFVDIKRGALFAYYTTALGLLRELGYQGNRALAAFPGCQHPAGTHI